MTVTIVRKTPNPWDADGIVDDARRLYLEEGLSASQVARALSQKYRTPISRNSVIGKLHRIGAISGGEQRAPRNHPQRPAQPSAAPKRHPAPALTQSIRADILGLEPLGPHRDFPPRGTCQFMTGEPFDPDWRMCGRKADPGTSWCPDHRKIIFQPNHKQPAPEQPADGM